MTRAKPMRAVKAMDYAKAAARQHSNLTMWHCIIGMLESGCFYGGETQAAKAQIIAICKRESARCLDRYDDALERLVVRK